MLLILRCVDPRDKAMALGLIQFAIGLFGNYLMRYRFFFCEVRADTNCGALLVRGNLFNSNKTIKREQKISRLRDKYSFSREKIIDNIFILIFMQTAEIHISATYVCIHDFFFFLCNY